MNDYEPGEVHTRSHPSRVRGLKYIYWLRIVPTTVVAPFTGAWIEIFCIRQQRMANVWSHPSRVRGLKSKILTNSGTTSLSHPSRVRGLKSACVYDEVPVVLCRTLRGCVD